MSSRSLQDEHDYARAMAEVERLWGAPAATPEAERLDELVRLVTAYEAEHHRLDGHRERQASPTPAEEPPRTRNRSP